MPQFLIQFIYASPSIKGMLNHPDGDNAAQASAMVESVSAKLRGYWYAFGKFDAVALVEAPNNTTAAAIAMAIRGTGQVSCLETTVLLTMEEAREAMRAAATATHLPPGEKGDQ